MRAIKKSFNDIPSSLVDSKREEEHRKNWAKKEYLSESAYKTLDVQKALEDIYNRNCAYCENTLLRQPKHIEHYRPKKKNIKAQKCDASTGYFWLAFSWDNLLLACTSCNGSKGSCFDIDGGRATYPQHSNPKLAEMQGLGQDLDKAELPKLVNPERELQSFFNEHLYFDFNGKIHSTDDRLKHTIKICNLNDRDLVKLRMIELNDLKNAIKRAKDSFKRHKNSQEYKTSISELARDQIKKIKDREKFSALRRSLLAQIKELEKIAI